MDINVSRLLLALASLNLSRNELIRLLQQVSTTPPHEIADEVAILQKNSTLPTHSDLDRFWPQKNSSNMPFDISIGDRVDRLLKQEAALSTSVAVNKLTSALINSDNLTNSMIPPLSRKSFKDWVIRLSHLVPEKEILRWATVIRNEIVHRPNSDWSLGKGRR
jgi:hypothetical protein